MSSGFHRVGANAGKAPGWDNRIMPPLLSSAAVPPPIKPEVSTPPVQPEVKKPVVTPPAPTPTVAPTELGPPRITRDQATSMGFTGNSCVNCGGMQMVRNGTCEKCNSCGSTTGCS